MTFDENIKERNLIIFFKFYGEFDIMMVFAMEQRKRIFNVSKLEMGNCLLIVGNYPFLFKMAHENIG